VRARYGVSGGGGTKRKLEAFLKWGEGLVEPGDKKTLSSE